MDEQGPGVGLCLPPSPWEWVGARAGLAVHHPAPEVAYERGCVGRSKKARALGEWGARNAGGLGEMAAGLSASWSAQPMGLTRWTLILGLLSGDFTHTWGLVSISEPLLLVGSQDRVKASRLVRATALTLPQGTWLPCSSCTGGGGAQLRKPTVPFLGIR